MTSGSGAGTPEGQVVLQPVEAIPLAVVLQQVEVQPVQTLAKFIMWGSSVGIGPKRHTLHFYKWRQNSRKLFLIKRWGAEKNGGSFHIVGSGGGAVKPQYTTISQAKQRRQLLAGWAHSFDTVDAD